MFVGNDLMSAAMADQLRHAHLKISERTRKLLSSLLGSSFHITTNQPHTTVPNTLSTLYMLI
jgi:hypothetical protein